MDFGLLKTLGNTNEAPKNLGSPKLQFKAYFRWKDMPGPKWFLMVPNADHGMETGLLEVVPALGAFALTHFRNKGDLIPKVTWDIDSNTGEITAQVPNDAKLVEANLWWGYSCGVNPWDSKLAFGVAVRH